MNEPMTITGPQPGRPPRRHIARWIQAAAIVAVLFGAVTILSGGQALFGDAETRATLGDIVPFVLWFNFAAGFAYVLAGIGLFLRKRRAAQLAVLIALATALVFVALGIHVAVGGDFEMRTVGAMALRTSIWTGLAILACRALGCRAPSGAAARQHDPGELRRPPIRRRLREILHRISGAGARPKSVLAAAIVAIVFGLMTIVFGAEPLIERIHVIRLVYGYGVVFVLWFSFISGFGYVLVGIGLLNSRRWAVRLAVLIAVANAVILVALGIRIALGTTDEIRTVGAMVLRTGVWIVIAIVACRALGWRTPKTGGP